MVIAKKREERKTSSRTLIIEAYNNIMKRVRREDRNDMQFVVNTLDFIVAYHESTQCL